jgi:hypothetical protein
MYLTEKRRPWFRRRYRKKQRTCFRRRRLIQVSRPFLNGEDTFSARIVSFLPVATQNHPDSIGHMNRLEPAGKRERSLMPIHVS